MNQLLVILVIALSQAHWCLGWENNAPHAPLHHQMESRADEATCSGDFECPVGDDGDFLDGFYPCVEDQCLFNFYDCIGGVLYIQDCPVNGSVFDPIIRACSFTCRIPTPPPTTVPPTECPENSTGFYPVNPDNCVPEFFICVAGIEYIDTCPNGTLFDPVGYFCTTEADCSKPTPTAEPYKCPDIDGSGFFPSTNDTCVPEYYQCIENFPYLQTCPAGGVFDPIKLVCVRPDQCSVGLPTARSPLSDCSSGVNGFYPAITTDEVCGKDYFICVRGEPLEKKSCPASTFFDFEKRKCVNSCS